MRLTVPVAPADLIITAVTTVVTLGGSVLAATGQPMPWPGLGLLAVACAALLWRRSHTVASLAVTVGLVALYYLAEFPPGPAALPLLVAVFFAAQLGRRTAAVIGAASAGATALVAMILKLSSAPTIVDMVAYAAVLALAVALGELSRARSERQAADRRRAIDGERLRIAQELHDLLAHQLSLINVLASAALHRRKVDQAFDSLGQIKEASRDTLRELRVVLGVLRQGDDEDLAWAPGLDRLDDLVSRTITAGLPVRLDVAGTPCPLPAAVDLAAYRIIQEALTNVLRHANAAQATVALRYGEELLEVQVDDDGKGVSAHRRSEGHGLTGMRERAYGVGGTLTAESGAKHGFRVHAVLPIASSWGSGIGAAA
jgi:signal transduction histidine kinase